MLREFLCLEVQGIIYNNGFETISNFKKLILVL